MKTPVSKQTNPIGSRLKFEMKKRGITSADLAKRAEVKTSFIYDIINGKSANPSSVKLARVADILGISLSALADPSSVSQVSAFAHIRQEDYVSVPRIIADISAMGATVILSDSGVEPLFFSKAWVKQQLGVNPQHLRMLSIRGDSMEPTLYHDDVVLVDTNSKIPSPPGIFVLFDGFGLVTKRMEYTTQHRPPHVRVLSDNPQYSTYERSMEDVSIIGRVVWFARTI